MRMPAWWTLHACLLDAYCHAATATYCHAATATALGVAAAPSAAPLHPSTDYRERDYRLQRARPAGQRPGGGGRRQEGQVHSMHPFAKGRARPRGLAHGLPPQPGSKGAGGGVWGKPHSLSYNIQRLMGCVHLNTTAPARAPAEEGEGDGVCDPRALGPSGAPNFLARWRAWGRPRAGPRLHYRLLTLCPAARTAGPHRFSRPWCRRGPAAPLHEHRRGGNAASSRSSSRSASAHTHGARQERASGIGPRG